MQKFISSFILIILFSINYSLFDNVKYMESSQDSMELQNKILKSKKLSLLLIYSDGYPHCRRFELEYIKLSEKYNSLVNFYLQPSKYNKKQFNIRGVPTVFFFNGKKFIEHKGLNNFDIISHILDNDYLKICEEVNYDYIFNSDSNLLFDEYKNSINNSIIAFFPDVNTFSQVEKNENITKINKLIRKKALDNFINKTQKIISLIDNCYYIKDIKNNNENSNFLNEGVVITISKTKGINVFKGYQEIFMDNEEQDEKYYDDKIAEIGEIFSKFLIDKIKDYYIEITESKMGSKLRAFIKRNCIFFVYKNEKEKKEYISQINSLIAMTKNDKYPLFDYILYKYNCDLFRISYHFKSAGIYYADKKLTKFSKPIDLHIVIEMINTHNKFQYSEKRLREIININDTNKIKTSEISNKYIDKNEAKKQKLYYDKIKEKIIENQLKNYFDDTPQDNWFGWNSVKSILFFFICIIGYSFGFDYFYKKVYPGKSIFNFFKECMIYLDLCDDYDDEEDISIEEKQIQIKNKKRDDINDEGTKLVKVQLK